MYLVSRACGYNEDHFFKISSYTVNRILFTYAEVLEPCTQHEQKLHFTLVCLRKYNSSVVFVVDRGGHCEQSYRRREAGMSHTQL